MCRIKRTQNYKFKNYKNESKKNNVVSKRHKEN